VIDHAALAGQTLPGLLLERARRTPDRVAFRAKILGIYRETTWQALADRVAAVALALGGRGLGRRDTVAILGNACPEWTVADLAAQAAGAISYGIYPTSSPAELGYLLRHGGARILVAEDQEHLDRALAVAGDCPRLELVVVIDTRTLFLYDDPRVIAFARLEAEGRERLAGRPGALAAMVAALSPEDPAVIVYTSGTTAHPRGAVLPHGRHLAAAANMLGHYPELARGAHRVVAFLPLSHVMGRDATITLPLLADIVPHYPEDVEAFAETLYEVAPTFLFTVPRYLQKIASHLLVALESAGPVKRRAYQAAMAIGRRHLARHWEGRPSLVLRLAYGAARALVLDRLLDKVGFRRLRLVLSGGAALPPDVAALWQAWGVNVLEVYGQTEAAGAILTGQQGDRPRPGHVGVPGPTVELALGPGGEVLARSPYFFAGYWEDTDATAGVWRDGWLHTGDVGEWTAGGALRLIDRQRDFLVTAGGKNVSPAQVESHLRASPYVSEAAVFGDGRKYLVALLELDEEVVAEWARAHGVPCTGYTALVTHPAVLDLVEDEVARANAQLARVEQVKAFRVLPRELDPEDGDEPVTPTRKVKRRLMAERYRHLLEEMYSDAEERRIGAAVEGLIATP
jgi:long-chain acyl-CoA synthetase